MKLPKVSKEDKEWLRGFCYDYTDDVVDLITYYMNKAIKDNICIVPKVKK